jgi:hypothetical protein
VVSGEACSSPALFTPKFLSPIETEEREKGRKRRLAGTRQEGPLLGGGGPCVGSAALGAHRVRGALGGVALPNQLTHKERRTEWLEASELFTALDTASVLDAIDSIGDAFDAGGDSGCGDGGGGDRGGGGE